MRISDWSSDVCSSDLVPPQLNRNAPEIGVRVNAMGLLEAFLIVEVRNELLVRPVIIGLVARYPLIFYDRHHAAMRGVPVHRVMIDMIVDHPAAGVIAPDHDLVALDRKSTRLNSSH